MLPASGAIRCISSRASRRLAAAGLADDAQGLALGDGERHVVDRLHHACGRAEQAAADREMLAQVARQQQRLGRAAAIARSRRAIGSPCQAFTSMAARSPSLTRLKQIEVMKIITPGSARSTGST